MRRITDPDGGGSSPSVRARRLRSVLETWATDHCREMGHTFCPKGFRSVRACMEDQETTASDFVDPTLRRLSSVLQAITSRQLGGLYEDCAFGAPHHLLSSP